MQLQACCAPGWSAGANRIGAYWPIKGEFDPLPALFRWSEGGPEGSPRRIGLPVADRATGELRFHVWYPGLPDGAGCVRHPQAERHRRIQAALLLVPCVGYGPGGIRLGYGGGFFDRTLRALTPRPITVGVSFTHGFLPFLRAAADDLPLDALLTEDGVMWQRPLGPVSSGLATQRHARRRQISSASGAWFSV